MSLAVVGDCLLDVDLIGTVNRLCPDAPAPVLDLDHEFVRPGGAGLAARLAAADGVAVTLVTCIAEDADGDRIRAELSDLPTVSGPAAASTAVKTRLLASGQSIARVDRGGQGAPPTATDEMLDAVRAADAVLVSDYGRGLTADGRLRGLLTWLARRKPVVWDPHPRGADPVAGVAVVTPNLVEATSATGLIGDTIPIAGRAATVLRSRWQAEAVAVTLGPGGALVYEGGAPCVIPADRVEVRDPCGAGDRFASVLAARLMDGASAVEATRTAVKRSAGFLANGGVSTLDSAARPAPEPAPASAPVRLSVVRAIS